MKPFDTIPFKEQDEDTIKLGRENLDIANAAFEAASEMMLKAERRFWKQLRDNNPELDRCDFRIDDKNKQFVITACHT